MTRAVIAATLLIAVLAGGFFIGAINTILDDTGPDW